MGPVAADILTVDRELPVRTLFMPSAKPLMVPLAQPYA